MEILRDEELEVHETRIDQFLCNVLDRDVRLCDDPDCIRFVLSDFAVNNGGDNSGLAGPRRTLISIVR